MGAGRMRHFRAALVLFGMMVALGVLVKLGLTTAVDRPLLTAIALRQGKSPDALIDVAQFFSWIGNGDTRIVLALLFAAWLVWQKRVAAAITVLVVPPLAGTSSTALKMIFGRERPQIVPHLDRVGDLSFPSGHATAGFAIFVLFALLLPSPMQKWLKAPLIITACCIALSRPMLGVHWPTDIVAGGLLGTAAAMIGMGVVTAREGYRRTR